MTQNTRIWIVVADAASARVIEYQGPDGPLKTVPDGEFAHPDLATQDLVTDSPGRGYDNKGFSEARSTMDPPTDPKAHEEFRFLGTVAKFIEARASQFDELIIAAGPKALGVLRKQLPGKIHDKVRAEINKDFTNIPMKELRQHLQGAININA